MGHPEALARFKHAVEDGFHCYTFFTRDPWLDSLRSSSEFNAIVRTAETGYRDAAAAFVTAGGEQMLGPVQKD